MSFFFLLFVLIFRSYYSTVGCIRSERIGSTWPWYWIGFSCGFSRRPFYWARRPLSYKRPLCTTIAFRSISDCRKLLPEPWAKEPHQPPLLRRLPFNPFQRLIFFKNNNKKTVSSLILYLVLFSICFVTIVMLNTFRLPLFHTQ